MHLMLDYKIQNLQPTGPVGRYPEGPTHWRFRSKNLRFCLESQVAQNSSPLYPKVAHTRPQVAHDYAPLALQTGTWNLCGRVQVTIPTLVTILPILPIYRTRFRRPDEHQLILARLGQLY